MTIAITGATSMLGVATIKECINQNIKVLAFCRENSKNITRLPQSQLIQIINCDLSEINSFDAQDLCADVFIHFGWTNTDKVGRNDNAKQLLNVQYTLDAVKLANNLGCKRFIGAGSQAEYGTPNTILKEDTPCNPLIPYGVAKYAAGKMTGLECSKLGMEYNWVRILSVYGKNDNEGTLIKTLIQNAKTNTPMGLSGCEQIWDYLHEEDAGRAFVAIAQKGVNGRVYNLGSGIGRKLKEYVNDLINVINPNYKPDFGLYSYSITQPKYLVANVKQLIEDTGWKPIIDFKDGIKKIEKQWLGPCKKTM